MLEIIALISLGKFISKILKEKGRKPTMYVILMVFLWLSFEVIGALVGNLFFGEGLIPYGFALLGAATSALVSYQVAISARPKAVVHNEETVEA